MAKQFRRDINYYKLLQVDPEADKLVIKSTYYTILNKLHTHPDKGGDEEKTKLINEAYQVLSSSELRREYDSFLVELAGQRSHPYTIPEGEMIRGRHPRDRVDTFPHRQDPYGEPFGGIFSISTAFDRWFQDVFTGEQEHSFHRREWNPPVNIYREQGNLIIQFEVPGVAWQDLHIEVKNDILTVSGEKRPEFRERNEYLKVEFPYGGFRRSFQLPAGMETGKMTASLGDGVLILTIPASQATASRIIPIT